MFSFGILSNFNFKFGSIVMNSSDVFRIVTLTLSLGLTLTIEFAIRTLSEIRLSSISPSLISGFSTLHSITVSDRGQMKKKVQ